MKVYFFLVLISLMYLFPLGRESKACPGQCTEPWNDSTTPLVADTNNCYILINYKWRECNIGGQIVREVEITSIDLITGGNCENTSPQAIMNIAVKSILFHSSGIFLIDNPTIPYEITLYIPSCWRFQSQNNSTTMVSCDPDRCCTTNVTMQTIDDWPQAVNQTVTPSNPSNCSGLVGYTCDYICNSIDVPLNEPLIPWHYDPSILCFQMCPNGILNLKDFTFQYNQETIFVSYAVLRNCPLPGGNNVNMQFKILHIQIIHRNPNLQNRSSYEILHQSTRRMLKNYLNTTSNYRARVYVHQCWKTFGSLSPNDLSMYACQPPNECCYGDFHVFRINNIDYAVRLGNAVIIEPNDCGANICTYGCNWLKECIDGQPWSYCDLLNDYFYLLRTGALEQQITDNQDQFFKIKKQTVKNNLSFEIENYGYESVKVQIFDEMSNLLASREVNIKNGESIINIDFPERSLSNGVYYYLIMQNSKILDYGMFIFVK